MRGTSNRTVSNKQQSVQPPSTNNSAHLYFNAQVVHQSQQVHPMHQHQHQQNQQYVHQVIYNQGSVVINNPPSQTPTISYPMNQST